MIDIKDGTKLIDKIMAHFGWYKVKMVEFPVSNYEVNHHFTVEPQINFTDEEIQNALNKIKEQRSSQQEHQEGNRSRKTTKAGSSNSIKRSTRSKKESE